jgi:hypothetical protein
VDPHAKLLLPAGLARANKKAWEDEPAADSRMQEVLSRITGLGAQGLTATMVVGDYLRRRLAPLRERGRPAWMYTGVTDHGRTAAGPGSNFTSDTVHGILKVLLGSKVGASDLPRPDLALCANSFRDEIRRTLPEFDGRGIKVRDPAEPARELRIPGAAAGESATAANPEARGTEEERRRGKRARSPPSPPVISLPSSPDLPPPPTRIGDQGQGGSTAHAPEFGIRLRQW